MLKVHRLLLVVFCAVGICAFAQDEIPTQVTPQNRGGELPFSSTIGTNVEQVPVTGGGLHVTIPIAHLPGRGMNYDLDLNYDARFWVDKYRSAGGSHEIWNLEIGGLWTESVPYVTYTTDTDYCNTLDANSGRPTGNVVYNHDYIYHDATGAKYPLALNTEYATCDEGGYQIRNTREPDLSGSGIVATMAPNLYYANAVYLPNGTQALVYRVTPMEMGKPWVRTVMIPWAAFRSAG